MKWMCVVQILIMLSMSACAQDRRRTFLPSEHGFAFRNSFEGDPLPEFLRDSPVGVLIRKSADAGIIDVPDRFGLCGGMCAAATDYWLDAKPIPPDVSAPKPRDPLYDYLKRRQTDSLGSGGVMAVKFLDWMQLEERGPWRCTQELTARELDDILARVKSDGFAHIGLVYVDQTGRPWQNHQVLVYGFHRDLTTLTLRIYDPNFPRRDDVELFVRFEKDVDGRKFAHTAQRWRGGERHVRGVFGMPYMPKMPEK
jgi:hypothetical protein